jgi:gamma-glutamyltranspeptidase/glutathione hydrolase
MPCRNAFDAAHPARALLLLLALWLTPQVQAAPAAVAMPDRYSAAAAQQVMLAGGNAVDAAIAAAFVLAVTFPEAGNIGGGGFMLSYMQGEAAFLDFRERAPLASHRDMYLDEQGNFVQQRSLIGGLAAGVPGTVRGLQAAHQRYGTLSWQQLLQPAVELAGNGFVVPPELAKMAAEKIEETAGKTNFVDYFSGLQDGKTFAQPELARSLQLIARDPDSFYRGEIAGQIAAQMQASGGIISLQDLADYRAVWRTPLQYYWQGLQVLTAPPPSSGGIALLQLLGIREFAQPLFAGVVPNSPRYVHLLAEIEKRVFADRAQYLGDSDFVEVPVGRLLDPLYLQQRARSLNPTAISGGAAIEPGLESHQTTHFSIVDSSGNAVALTYTLNWEFGSGVVVSGAGFLLNNEMDDFSAKPGVPNKFGVVGNDRNAIEPGKRMLSSMTPTLLLRNGRPELVIGTPGGSTIFTSIYQVILNLYLHDMPLQAAVDATRFHHQLPDAGLIRHDRRELPAATRDRLEQLGYTLEPNSWGDLGDIQVIRVTPTTIEAASDSRGRGSAMVLRERGAGENFSLE